MSIYNKLSDKHNRLTARVAELSIMLERIGSCNESELPAKGLRLTIVDNGWASASTLVPANSDILPIIKQYLEGQLYGAKVALELVDGKLKAVDTLLGACE